MADETVKTSRFSSAWGSGPRRSFLARALGLGAGAIGLSAGRKSARGAVIPPNVTDPGILNFALNLEYLEAEFYTYAVAGTNIATQGIPIDGTGAPGPTVVKGGSTIVPFVTPLIKQFAMELAVDEQKHVLDLRTLLQGVGVTPIAKPTIDLLNSFNKAAQLAGLGSSFDPFANEVNFLLGSYIFEDVGVTAYHGAAPLIRSKSLVGYAAGIYAVEGYHAGAIRTMLAEQPASIQSMTDAISAVRRLASGANDDYGVDDGPMGGGPAGNSSIMLDDAFGRAFARSFRQILNIVYLSPATAPTASGGFFPNGVNGTIRG